MIVNLTKASAQLGFKSRTPLQRLLHDGFLKDYEAGKVGRQILIEMNPEGLPCLRSRIQALTEARVDSPLWEAVKWQWEDLAAYANAFVDFEKLGPGPWTGEQWKLLDNLMGLAVELLDNGRRYDPNDFKDDD